jgi:release factor glutamine methyltransferase
MAHPEATLSPEQQTALEAAVARLELGDPLPYVLGHWEFYGLDFVVTPDVLIPRPESELLVETAIHWLQALPRSAICDLQSPVLEVGTGSGCIAISLTVHLPGIRVTAADISPDALEIARANAIRHGVGSRIEFIQADLLDLPLSPYRLLLANLPYIPTAALQRLDIYGKEPALALDGGPDGLDLIRRLLASAPPFLAPQGRALLEIEASQGQAAKALARRHFPTAEISVLPDLAGRDRLLSIQT